jgi:sec-independent protein translocase protein TatB
MFDMGFTEMMLIGIVALVVIGPEKLPGVARTTGKYFGRLKRFVTTVRADVEQELRADELRDILSKQQEELNSLKDSINVSSKAFEAEVAGVGKTTKTTPGADEALPDSAATSEIDSTATSNLPSSDAPVNPDSSDAPVKKVKS